MLLGDAGPASARQPTHKPASAVAATVTDDVTLSDFGSAAETDEPDTGEQEAEATENGDSGLSTYAWGTYRCSRCDTETERVWRADEDLVCPACKRW